MSTTCYTGGVIAYREVTQPSDSYAAHFLTKFGVCLCMNTLIVCVFIGYLRLGHRMGEGG